MSRARKGSGVFLPKENDLLQLTRAIFLCAHDQNSVQKIFRQTVWAHVLGPSNSGHPPVCGHDYQRRQLFLKSSIEEGETLDVEHVHFVNE